MPKTLSRRAKKMVYDVHSFIKKETEKTVTNLKQINYNTKEATDKLLKNLNMNVNNLNQIRYRTDAGSLYVLNQTCHNLELIRRETAEAIRTGSTKLGQIISKLKQNQKRTAEATNTSVRTVRTISKQGDSSKVILVDDDQLSESESRNSVSDTKRKHPDEDDSLSEAVKVLKKVAATVKNRDEAELFGEFVASKIRKMDRMTIANVQHQIQSIVYTAEMDMLGKPGTHVATVTAPGKPPAPYPDDDSDDSATSNDSSFEIIIKEETFL